MPIEVLVSLQKVHKKIGNKTILQNLNLDIHHGDFILLLGSNGAGKSTLLEILSSLSTFSGEIFFQNSCYQQNLIHLRKSIGYIGQQHRFYQDLTALENLHFIGKLYGITNVEEKSMTLLQEQNLAHTEHLPVSAFSKGMIRRLEIARIFLHSPIFLLLDEPFSGIDQQFLRQFSHTLAKFKENGGTVILATHQIERAWSLANRIVTLQNKTIHHDLSTHEINLQECSQWLQNFSPQ